MKLKNNYLSNIHYIIFKGSVRLKTTGEAVSGWQSQDMANKLVQYIKDSKSELKKVTWPSRKEVVNHTLLVIAFSLAMAIFLGAIDFGLSELVKEIIS